MPQNIKKLKVAPCGRVNKVASLRLGLVLAATLFIFTVIAPASSVFAKHYKYKQPYASVLMEEEEEPDEECSAEECGSEDEEIGDEEIAEEKTVTPPPSTKNTVKEPAVEEKKTTTEKKKAEEKKIEEKKVEEKQVEEPVQEKTVEKTSEEEAQKAKEEELKQLEVKKAAAAAAAAEAAKKAKEAEALKQLEEKKKAEALEAEKKAKEEAELKEEEAKRLEELRKKAEEEALKRQEEELRKKKEEEAIRETELKRLAEETKLKELFVEQPLAPVPPPSAIIAELQRAAGEDPEEVNLELVKQEAELAVKKVEAVERAEMRAAEAERVFKEEFKKAKEVSKRKLIAKASERRHRVVIRDNKEGLKTDGVSYEAAVFLAPELPPTAAVAQQEKEVFAHPVEKKLFGVPQNKTIDQLAKPTLGLQQGTKVATRGTAILAAAPEANKSYELHAIDTSGRSRIVGKQMSSDNKKLVFTTSTLPPGKYALQVRPVSPLSARFPYFASTLNAGAGAASDPVLIEAKSDPGIPQPVVESIEGLAITGLRDIQVESGADGKVTVSGSSDVTTMVIGTFSSAIFTSAMLADVDTGRFEVVSPRALEAGDHEVVIYASRPEEATQSVPVKVKFRLIQAAKAAVPQIVEPVITEPAASRSSAQEKRFPLAAFLGFGGLAVLLIAIGVFLKKSKRTS